MLQPVVDAQRGKAVVKAIIIDEARFDEMVDAVLEHLQRRAMEKQSTPHSDSEATLSFRDVNFCVRNLASKIKGAK